MVLEEFNNCDLISMNLFQHLQHNNCTVHLKTCDFTVYKASDRQER